MGTERGLQMVEDSLQQDGVGRSIVADAQDRIPAGNKTLQAAMNAGIEDVIEIETNGRAIIVHKRTDWDLTDPQGAARRYAYRDNRASEVSLNWSTEQLLEDINAGVDLSKMFTGNELNVLLAEINGVNNPYGEWVGMPEFEQETIKLFHSIKLNFETEEAMIEFAKLVNQTITDKTTFIYYPKLQHIDGKNYKAIDENES